MRKSVLLLALLWLLTALGPARPALAAAPAYATPDAAQAPRYDMTVALDIEHHRMRVTGTMRIPAADRPRDKLTISLNNDFHGLEVRAVGATAAAAGPVELKQAGGYITYELKGPRPFPAGRPVELAFSYEGGEQIRNGFYIGPNGSFASGINTDWYPNLQDPWRPRGVGVVRFELPSAYTLVAAGRRRGGQQPRPGPAVYEWTRPTAFAFTAGRYHVVRRGGPVPVAVYFLTPRPYQGAYAGKVQGIIGFYGKLFGPYPFPDFSLVEVPDAEAAKAGFSGQGEAGLIFATSRYLGAHVSTAYYGHEIGHQWWGQLVQKDVDAASGFYMPDEATAQWGSLQAVGALEGPAAAERYRRTGYPGYVALQNGLGYLAMESSGMKDALDAPRSRLSHTLANSKGLLVLDMLAERIGRERFAAILRGVLRRHAGGSLSWATLKQEITAGSGQDLSGFWADWAARTGAPDLSLDWHEAAGAVEGRILQAGAPYGVSVEVEARGDCGIRTWRVEARGPETGFSRPFPCPVKSVVLDPHYRILRWTEEFHALAPALVPYVNWATADDYPQAYDEMAAELAKVPAEDRFGLRFEIEWSIARMHLYDQHWAEARDHIQAALAAGSPRPEEPAIAWARLALTASKLGDRPLTERAAREAIRLDAKLASPTGAGEEAQALLDAAH